MKYASSLGPVLVLGSLAGCGGDWPAETRPAIGMVSVNGKAASGAVVTLYPVDQKVDARDTRPYAIADEHGNFTMTKSEAGDDAPLGESDLTITRPVDVT